MRSIAALSALAVPALALSYSHGDPRMAKRHHQLAEHALEQRDQVAPSSGRMARKIKRGDAAALSTSKGKKQSQTYTTTAIWYAETGWIGSCGVEFNDNDHVLGLPLELYPNPAEKSELCGQSVVVKNSQTGQEITAVVADASQRDAYTTFTKGAYQALGGDLDVGELSVSYHFANADSIASSLPSAFSTSATGKEKSAVKTSASSSAPQTSAAPAPPASSSSKAYSKGGVQAAAAAPQTTAAPVTTTSQAPAYDSASAASASSKASADAAWASSSSAEAAKLWASSSSAQAAASASAKAQADAAWASSSAAQAAASASSKAAADAAWAASSSKSAAAAAATSAAPSNNDNNSGGGSGHVYTGGIATFFYQNGVAGNCGQVNPDSLPLVALPTATYANGAHCGKYVTITRSDTGKSINALVADSCPTCSNNDCLDLSWGAFSALGGTQSMGIFDITWQFDN